MEQTTKKWSRKGRCPKCGVSTGSRHSKDCPDGAVKPRTVYRMAPKSMLDLIRYVSFAQVQPALCYYYPETTTSQLRGYKKVFNLLRKMKKVRTDKEEMLEILVGENPLKGDIEDTYYGIATNQYSLSFRPWVKCVSLAVSPDTLSHYKVEEIVAHFLWELTFYGYSEKEMQKHADELYKKVKEVNKKKS